MQNRYRTSFGRNSRPGTRHFGLISEVICEKSNFSCLQHLILFSIKFCAGQCVFHSCITSDSIVITANVCPRPAAPMPQRGRPRPGRPLLVCTTWPPSLDRPAGRRPVGLLPFAQSAPELSRRSPHWPLIITRRPTANFQPFRKLATPQVVF